MNLTGKWRKIALLEAQVNASIQRESRSEIRAPVSGTLYRR